jgi:dolichyl-phosphate-mannose--protein O-mannosyl transferase
VPMYVFARGEVSPAFTIGRLPLLDVGTSIFFVLGSYWYLFQSKLDRTKLLTIGLIFGLILAGLNGSSYLAFLLPFVYLVAIGGLALMLQQWFTVFPRNPLARGIGVGVMSLLIAVIGFYHLQSYFVAWPNTPATKQHFQPGDY